MEKLARNLWLWFATLLRWKQRLLDIIKPAITFISKIGIAIIGAELSIYLYINYAKYNLFTDNLVSSLLIGIGGVVATMLALVFSLSMIPIQKAVESYSPSVVWIIKEDKIFQGIFMLLAVVCISALIFSGTLQSRISLSAGIILLSIALDLLRWHYRRVLDFLSPLKAISLLTQHIIKYTDNMKKLVDKNAKIQWHSMSSEEKGDASIEHVKSSIYLTYQASNNYVLSNWISELAEIAQKAINKGENHIAETSISAIVKIANYYLNVRKNNLITEISPETLFVVIESDVDKVLNTSYERLKDLNTIAVASNNESICIHILKAYGTIAIFTANLESPRIHEHRAPWVHMPIYYMNECVKLALPKNFIDVGLQGARIYKRIVINSPIRIQFTDIIKPANDNIYGIAVAFILLGKGALANETIKEMLEILNYLLENDYHDFNKALEDILENVEALLPMALMQDKATISSLSGHLLETPYDLSNELSLGYLLDKSTKLIKKSDHTPWLNPYNEFIDIGETLYGHFRKVAEKSQFNKSFLFWHIIQTLKHISKVYYKALQMDVTDDMSHKNELVRQLPRLYSFTWAVFKNAEYIHYPNAEETCDMLSWSGLLFADKEYLNVTKNCIDNIFSVSRSYYEKTDAPNPFDIADLLMGMWHIRVYAENKELTELINYIDDKFTEFAQLTNDSWKNISESIENRKSHLVKHLAGREDRYHIGETSEDMLKELLKCTKH